MSSQHPQGAGPAYTERLWVPVGWWVLAALFALSLMAAVFFYLGPPAAAVAGLLVMVVAGAGFVAYGRARIEVGDQQLLAAGAMIEWRYITGAQALDEPASRRRRGPDADARAFLVLRPYLSRAVEVRLDDPQDPTPYWLIGSRHPQRLAAAITARLEGTQRDRHGPNTSSGTDSSRDTLKS